MAFTLLHIAALQCIQLIILLHKRPLVFRVVQPMCTQYCGLCHTAWYTQQDVARTIRNETTTLEQFEEFYVGSRNRSIMSDTQMDWLIYSLHAPQQWKVIGNTVSTTFSFTYFKKKTLLSIVCLLLMSYCSVVNSSSAVTPLFLLPHLEYALHSVYST
jgi:hypothetical protein